MVVFVARGLLRRPSLSGRPTVTFCSVHFHNVVAKKRDASTDLLRRLQAHMAQYDADFIGGDFNMGAFSTVGDVFADPEISAPGNSLLWGLVPWATQIASVLGFSSWPSARMNGMWMHTAATNSATRIWHLGPETPRPTFLFFLHLRTTKFPGPDSITRSQQAQQRRLERKASKHERRQCQRKLTQPSAS